MLQDFQQHIYKNFPFLEGKKLLIAVSGGIDSVVLCNLLHQSNFSFSLAHCNFRLRGKESDKDEVFVQQLANQLQQKYFVKHFNTESYAKKNNISIQMAARDLRYAWFDELLKKLHFDYLLTAHHADDNLETFLINLTRGTGLEGLTGIPAINKQTIRPLLSFSRKEIYNFAIQQKFNWREDKSNAETKYLRNKIRHKVIPVLKQLNPNLLNSFLHTTRNLQGSNSIVKDRIKVVEEEVKQVDGNIVQFDIKKIETLHKPKAYLYEILKDYGFTEWDDVYDLLSSQAGKQIFSKTHRLIKDRDFILLSTLVNKKDNLESIEIFDNQTYTVFNNYKINLNNIDKKDFDKEEYFKNNSNRLIFVDKDKLHFPLNVRKWKKGDYFYPLGMQGKKKLSKYFKELKLSILEKENIDLLCSNNEIVWIINKRLDNRYKITENTKNILKIKIINK